MDVKLPSEIKRKIRPISERFYYKANEFRTIALYLSFGIFKGLLVDKYFNNLIKFIIFLRILCQDEINKENIIDAKKIIVDFIQEYEELYGQINMTSNVHGHIHLPEQNFSNNSELINPKKADFDTLVFDVKLLINEFCKTKQLLSNNIIIFKSNRAINKKLEYHSIDYDRKFESLNNHLIQFSVKKENLYGSIVDFYSINEFQMVLVKKFEQKKKDVFFKNFSSECSKNIDKFFQIGEFLEELTLISLDSIERRCLSVRVEEDVIITPISNLLECD
ncbi:unnamed protein product [Brachionus calyciflorus]|uniref:Uncharacterized protein n=1 Tax=Brachionus calyciflorus TaxID=104777 RepID=A0A813NCD0_9BILA|nr:unnamed protein product [Brachionus calyciflorus]